MNFSILGRCKKQFAHSINVDNAVELGMKQMKEFESGWPTNFNDKISCIVKTQAKKRHYVGHPISSDNGLISQKL